MPKRSPAPSPRRPAPSPRNNPAQSPRAIPTSAGAIAPVPPRQRRVTCTIEAPDGSEETRLLSGHLADASLEEVRRAAKAKFSRRASSELFVKADAGDGTEVTLVDDDDWRLAREQLAALEHLKLRLSPDRRLRPGRRASVADRAAKTAWTEANGAGPSSSGGGAGPSAAGGAAGGAGSGGGTGRCSMSGGRDAEDAAAAGRDHARRRRRRAAADGDGGDGAAAARAAAAPRRRARAAAARAAAAPGRQPGAAAAPGRAPPPPPPPGATLPPNWKANMGSGGASSSLSGGNTSGSGEAVPAMSERARARPSGSPRGSRRRCGSGRMGS